MSRTFLRPLTRRDAWVGTFAEFIATFLFVYLGCGSVVSSGIIFGPGLDLAKLLVIAIAHGLAISVLASATGGVSGGHINPAVTFAMIVVRQIPIFKGLMYIVAQFAGAFLGAGLLHAALPGMLEGGLGTHAINPKITYLDAVILEAALSFALLFVIFGTAVDRRGTGNTAPLAIGFTILVDHLVGVPLTGASMNPARTFGPAIWLDKWQGFWVYLAGPLIGATLAAIVYTFAFLRTDTDAKVLKDDTRAGESQLESTQYSKSPDIV